MNRRIVLPISCVLALGASVPLAAQSADQQNRSTPTQQMTTRQSAETKGVVEIITASPDHKILAEFLKKAELVERLEGKSSYTVFAPTDEAFEKLDQETRERLRNDENELLRVISFHVVPKQIGSQENRTGTTIRAEGPQVYDTLSGRKIVVGPNGRISGTMPEDTIQAQDGVIYVFDRVLMPPEMTREEARQFAAESVKRSSVQGGGVAVNLTDEQLERLREARETRREKRQDEEIRPYGRTGDEREELREEREDYREELREDGPGSEDVRDARRDLIEERRDSAQARQAVPGRGVDLDKNVRTDSAETTGRQDGNAPQGAPGDGYPNWGHDLEGEERPVDVEGENLTEEELEERREAKLERREQRRENQREQEWKEASAEIQRRSASRTGANVESDEYIEEMQDARQRNAVLEFFDDPPTEELEDLREAERELREAIEGGADADEIRDLREEVAEAKRDYREAAELGGAVVTAPDIPGLMVDAQGQDVRKGNTITYKLSNMSELSTLNDLVKEVNLQVGLSDAGPYTLFAPTNEAFEAIDERTLEEYRNNPEQLKNLLLNHVAKGEIMAQDLKDRSMVRTVVGEPVIISDFQGKTHVGGGELVRTDIRTSNGVIHIIDSMLPVTFAIEDADEVPLAPPGQ
ncbi:MAG: fasciclin domain-containing protein [Sumerlaeia bacterium]